MSYMGFSKIYSKVGSDTIVYDEEKGHYFKPGLTQAYGPPGIGKTKNFLKYVRDIYGRNIDVQNIFITSVHSLLKDTVSTAEELGIPYTYLAPNDKYVAHVLRGERHNFEDEEQRKAEPLSLQSFLSDLKIYPEMWMLSNNHGSNEIITPEYLHNLEVDICNYFDLLDKSPKELKGEIVERLSNYSSMIVRHFANNAILLEQFAETEGEADGKYTKLNRRFRGNNFVRRLLPMIRFKDDNLPLLIATTKKVMFSFYDGHKFNSIQGDLSGYNIFIDEFDFQEDEILDILAETNEIKSITPYINQILNDGLATLNRGSYPQKFYDRVESAVAKLYEQLTEIGLETGTQGSLYFEKPHNNSINLFRGQSIYNHDSIRHLFVKNTKDGIMIYENRNDYSSKNRLSRLIDDYDDFIRRITDAINRLEPQERDSFCESAFNANNNHRNSDYTNVVSQRMPNGEPVMTRGDYLRSLSVDELPNTYEKIFGFTNYNIQDNKITHDPLKAHAEKSGISSTPNAVLINLASKNHVWATGATTTIFRAYEGFDLDFNKNFLKNKFGEDYYVGNDIHKEFFDTTIQDLINEKENLRGTQYDISFDTNCVSSNHVDIECVSALIEKMGKSENGGEHRVNSTIKVIKSIRDIAGSDFKTGIVFSSSFGYLRELMKVENVNILNNLGLKHDKLTKDSFDAWLIESKKDFSQELVKRMNFLTTGKDQQGIIILFFNAETSKIKDFYRNYSDIYQFADKNDLKVAVSTQYQSSSIGVNLDYTYKNENGDMITSDIESAYFIDVDHYFFSKDDLKKSEKNKRKSNLEYNILTYKLQKLLFSKYISNCDFEQRVDELSNGSKKSIQRLNNSYKTRSNPMYADYCNTVVSRLIQRVGRLNRAWANVPKIKIVLSSDYIDLINYFSEHLYNYDEIEPTLPIIFKEVLSAAKAESEEFDFEEMTTKKHSPKKIIELIDVGFMTAIRNSRKSNMDQSSLEILSRSWEQIRSYSLAHDFHKPIIMPESVKSALPGYSGPDTFTIGEIALIEAPEGFDGENIWYIEDSDGSCRVFSKPPKENSKKLSYREIYEPIMLSHVCKKRFTNKGYHTSIHENNGYASGKILHPAFVQRILQGAIGEECVRALISHTNPRAATTTKLQHPNTMESWDFCVAQCNKVVIDAKYWSYITIDNKSKEPETIQHYIEMVKNLRKVYNKDVKYIVASLVQHNEEDQVYAYSIEQGPLSQFELHKADIIMIPGCLQKTGEQFEISMIFKSVFKQGNVIDQIITSNRIEDPKSA